MIRPENLCREFRVREPQRADIWGIFLRAPNRLVIFLNISDLVIATMTFCTLCGQLHGQWIVTCPNKSIVLQQSIQAELLKLAQRRARQDVAEGAEIDILLPAILFD